MADDKRTKIGPTGAVQAQRTPVPATDPHVDKSQHATSYLPPAPATTDPLLGATLAGRYTIIKKLGEGGMGAVYLATHNLLEKHVALKILHNEFSRKPDLVERFMQEAKAASRIRHENVIDISDFGSTDEGLVFFAMELLHGHDLHEEVARARLAGQLLPWARSKKIFLQICAALTAAHGKGIVHRDLKPENVYLVEFLGEGDFVKLLDFGIAKLTEVSENDRKLTRTGMLFGTPEYMSPEQARGEPHVDHRVDVYAMGCILFQLVTGRVPFEAENFMGVLSLHLTEPPPQIPYEVFDRIGAPREIGGVIARALEKDRAVRWQSIEELANAIRTVCGDPLPSSTGHMAQQRAPSVPAPAHTTGKAIAVPNTTPAPGSRVRTQWTGNLSVPQEDDERRPRSKLPLIIGAAAVVIAGGIAAFMVTRDRGKPAAPEPGSASGVIAGSDLGSAGSQVAILTPDAAPPDAPAVDLPPTPEKVTIKLDSKPHGAEIRDLANGVVIGKTPLTFKVNGSHVPRQFGLHLAGYGDISVELTPNRARIDYTEKLDKGASSSVVRQVPDPKPPDTGSAGSAVVKPDIPKPPDAGITAGSATKPPDTGSAKPPPPDCDDSDPMTPCLKGFGSAGAGSGH